MMSYSISAGDLRGRKYNSQTEVARALGCSQQAVSKAIANNRLHKVGLRKRNIVHAPAVFNETPRNAPDGPWLETMDGDQFEILSENPTVSLKALIWGCARQPRYAGQWREDVEFYSVAEHSLLCWRAAKAAIPANQQHKLETRRFLRTVLCHDLTEGILGDIPTPLKKLMPDYGRLEDNLYSSLARRFDLLDPIPDEVRLIDMRILRDETEQLLTERPARWREWGMPSDIKPLGIRTIQMSPKVAASTFAFALSSAGVKDNTTLVDRA